MKDFAFFFIFGEIHLMFLSTFMLNTLLILFLFRFLFLCCKSKKLQNFIDNFSHASHV